MRKIFTTVLSAMLFALCVSAEAQQTKKIPHIGVLYSGVSGASTSQVEGLRQGLRQLGYAEGKNIVIEYRFAKGKLDRLPDLAAELVRLKVDVIVAAGGAPVILAAKNATSTIPIVFPTAGDPVALGIVDSLARPEGNITGLTLRTPGFSGKRLELLKEVAPRARRVAVLGQEANAAHALDLKEMQTAASALGLQLHQIEVRGPNDFESAFSKMIGTHRATALLLQATPMFIDNRNRSRTWLQCTECQRSTTQGNLRRLVFSCPTDRTVSTWAGAPPLTWIRSSKAPSRPISLCSSPPSLNL
jgi:putative ABC transport system substrate-binding protein